MKQKQKILFTTSCTTKTFENTNTQQAKHGHLRSSILVSIESSHATSY